MNSELSSVQIPRIRGKMVTTRSCFDDCIATYAKFKKCDYELMYLNCWDVSWSNDENLPMIRKMMLSNNFVNDLYNYCGIKINLCGDSFDDANNVISELQKKSKLIITFFDSYYCPWDRGYHRYNSNHAFFVEGNDFATKDYICTDPYFEINHGKISYDDFKLGYKSYVNIEKIDITSQSDIKILFEKKLKSDMMKEYFIKVREWAKEFSYINTVKKELFISASETKLDVVNMILIIIDKRAYFLILLKYLARNYDYIKQGLEKFENKFLYIIEQWNICQGIIMKGTFRNNPQLIVEEVPKRLMDIIELEDECIDGLICIMENCNTVAHHNIDIIRKNIELNLLKTEGKKEYTYLNLDSYFNNEGVGYKNSTTADLTSANEYILLDSFFLNGILNANDMSFMINKKNNTNDNISCTNQIINVEPGYYKKIMFLGCSEWGSFSDDVIIHYVDGTQDKINLLYLDFVIEDVCNNSNNSSFKCKTIKRINGENELCDTSHFIYAKAFNINLSKKIKSIVLPACPCVHIFAISLML